MINEKGKTIKNIFLPGIKHTTQTNLCSWRSTPVHFNFFTTTAILSWFYWLFSYIYSRNITHIMNLFIIIILWLPTNHCLRTDNTSYQRVIVIFYSLHAFLLNRQSNHTIFAWLFHEVLNSNFFQIIHLLKSYITVYFPLLLLSLSLTINCTFSIITFNKYRED